MEVYFQVLTPEAVRTKQKDAIRTAIIKAVLEQADLTVRSKFAPEAQAVYEEIFKELEDAGWHVDIRPSGDNIQFVVKPQQSSKSQHFHETADQEGPEE